MPSCIHHPKYWRRDFESTASQRDLGEEVFEPSERRCQNEVVLNMVAEQVVRDIGFERNQNAPNHEDEKDTLFETSETRGLEITGSKIRGAPSTLGFES